MIFALHRYKIYGKQSNHHAWYTHFSSRASQLNHDAKFKEVDKKQDEIILLFKKLAQDIQGLDYHRYENFHAKKKKKSNSSKKRYSRSFSGGFEEFVR